MTNRIRLSILAVAVVLLAALASAAAAAPARTDARSAAPNYTGVKTYLLGRSQSLVTQLGGIQTRAERYYALAKQERFSYANLWRNHRAEVGPLLAGLKPAFNRAHKAYEEEEGIIAGVPSLAQYDVIMDSGTSAADDPQTAVPFDLRLPNGKVFAKPGNFFHALLEPTIWGTDARFVAPGGVKADLDGDGTVEFGEVLPDANVLVATARGFVSYARKSDAAARAWTPNASDVLTALVVMVPTVEGYFGEWKSSRAIAGAGGEGEGVRRPLAPDRRARDPLQPPERLQRRATARRAGRRRAERADRHRAPATHAVRRRDLRAGEGRQEVHPEAG